MKKKMLHGIVLLLAAAVTGFARAEAAPEAKPWPTHAPEATPYVRVFREEDAAAPTPTGEEPVSVTWDDIYERFGHFYARDEELALFRSLPPDEPYSFVPHSLRFVLDEGEALRMAELFDALEGCEARVIALRQVVSGLDDWGFLTVVTMTPARLFELSGEMDESFLFEQFYDSVRERFDIDYWPDGLYAEAEAALQGYSRRGCFCFEEGVLKELEKLDRDTVRDFALREHTPGGWNRNGHTLLWLLQGREGLELSLYEKRDSLESLCVVTTDLAHLSILSDTLPGRYLVNLADEAELSQYDVFVRFTADGEEVIGP